MTNVHSFLLITYIYLSHSTFSQVFFVKVHGGDPSRSLILLFLSRMWFCWSWSNWLSKLILICLLHAMYCQLLFSVTSTWSFCVSLQRIWLFFFFFFFFKCKPTVAAACSKGSPILDLLFCQVVRLSFSNLPQQLAFPDVNVDAVSVISFLGRQKIADVFFLSLLNLKERHQICRRDWHFCRHDLWITRCTSAIFCKKKVEIERLRLSHHQSLYL